MSSFRRFAAPIAAAALACAGLAPFHAPPPRPQPERSPVPAQTPTSPPAPRPTPAPPTPPLPANPGTPAIPSSPPPTPTLPSPSAPAPGISAPSPAAPALDAWSPRLEALSPARPEAYFLLAEEIAAEEKDPAARDTARRLYVLAYELDRAAPADARTRGMASSVCFGLAALASRDEERRWLRALARTLTDPTGFSVRNETSGFTDDALPAATALDLATVIGLARSGEGRRAEAVLEKPGVAEAFDALDASSQNAVFSIGGFVERAIRDWPICPQCRNRRAVPSGAKQGEMVLCDTCRGNPGPKLSELELVFQLRIESALLHGAHRSWAAQIVADGGAPLRDLDPTELAATYDVDPAKPLWRNGAWTEKP